MSQYKTFKKKNVVVTGVAGFIGSHLAERLVQHHQVIGLDDFSHGQVGNLESLLQSPDFIFLKHDLNEPLDLESFPELSRFQIKYQGVQEIYHLACPTSAREFDRYRLDTLRANSRMITNILDLAVKYQACFLHASSSVVYGPRPPQNTYFREEDWGSVDVLSPRACYDEGKRFAETCVATYAQVHGLNTRLARIFRTYGPRLRLQDGQMLSDFIVQALEGDDLVIYGNKDFSTSLTYVSDLVEGLVRLMAADADPGPVNFGVQQDYNLAEVAGLVVEAVGSSSKIVFHEPLPFMTPLGLPDIRKAKEILGWLPVVSLKDGIEKTIEYVRATKILKR